MSTPTTPDLTAELKSLAGPSATVEAAPAVKNVAKATAQDVNPAPNLVPPLFVVVRFGLNTTENEKERITTEMAKLAKRQGMPPIIVCPQGVSIAPVFEPAEMANWRKEIQELRVKCAQYKEQAEASKIQFNSVQRAAMANADKLIPASSIPVEA